jgi:branched-chain amino acid transport system substrate-binding protein
MNKIKKIILWLVVVVIVIAIYYGVIKKQTPTTKETIKIGAILPLTGEAAVWGQNAKTGIELAKEEINKKGGINGRKIEVIYEDSQCDPKTGASAAQKLITVDKVQVIIGDACSSVTLAIAPIANQNKVVLITPGSSADSISQAGEYIFRNYPKNSQFLGKVIELIEKLDKKKIAILFVNNDYGVGLKDYALQKISKEKIVLVEGHNQKETDFRTTLAKLKSINPDAVILATYYEDGSLILKQAKEMKINTLFLGTDAFDDPKVIEIAKEAAEGLVLSTVKPGAGPKFLEFKKAYLEKYNKEPVILSDFAYDTINIIAEAIEKRNYNGEDIKNYLYSIKNFQGASNLISFDENGDLINPSFTLKTIKNSQFVPYEE